MIRRRILRITLVFLLLVLISVVAANYYVENKIASLISEKLGEDHEVSVEDIDVNLIFGEVDLTNLKLHSLENTKGDSLIGVVGAIKINGFKVFPLIFSNKIHMQKLRVDSPNVTLSKRTGRPHNKEGVSKGRDSAKNTPPEVFLGSLELVNANFSVTRGSDTLFHSVDMSLKMKDIRFNEETRKKKIPISYILEGVRAKASVARLGKFQTLSLGSISLDEEQAYMEDVSLRMNYDKIAYQRYLKEEKDWIELSIPKVGIRNYRVDLNSEDPVYRIDRILLDSINATIYRNKMPPDQTPYKPLYSKMLRDMKPKIAIDTVTIAQSRLTYQEHKTYDGKMGYIYLTDMNIDITHINNVPKEAGKTDIRAKFNFMGHAPTSTHWSFKIQDSKDNFHITGTMRDLQWKRLNTFLGPNANIEVRGTLHKMAFDFKGNDLGSKGHMLLDYTNFHLDMLNKKTHKKEGFISSIASVLVRKNYNNYNKKVKEYKIERDRQKGFFNLLYLSLRKGLISG